MIDNFQRAVPEKTHELRSERQEPVHRRASRLGRIEKRSGCGHELGCEKFPTCLNHPQDAAGDQIRAPVFAGGDGFAPASALRA
jgi:hypothetical protein